MRTLLLFTAREWVLALGFTILILLFYGFGWQPLTAFEIKSYDFRANLRKKLPASPVVIIDINYQSIEELGPWPWPRSRIAEMISLLSSYDVSVIGLDLLYSDPSYEFARKDIVKLIEDLKKGSRKRKYLSSVITRLKKTEQKLDEDGGLSTAIKSARNVVMPMHFSLQRGNGDERSIIEKMMKRLYSGGMERELIYSENVKGPIRTISKYLKAIGHNNRIADVDGKIRREHLLIDYNDVFYPSFSLQIAAVYQKKYLKPIKNLGSIRTRYGLKIGNMEIPTDDDISMLISYNNPRSFTRYSFSEVIKKKVPAEKLKDRIVLIGLNDRERLMYSDILGLERQDLTLVAANVIENIINSNHVIRPEWAFPVELGAIACFGLFLAFIGHRLSRRASVGCVIVFFISWNLLAIYLFIEPGYWLSMVHPSMLLILGYVAIGIITGLVANKAKMNTETIESNKMLALSFQSQGMLDMALDKLMKCPVRDTSIREHLYNLALDFERKRMLNKAIVVYEHMLKVGKFKDVIERIDKLKKITKRVDLGKSMEETLIIDGSPTIPTLGRYEIIKELGHGAMGTVYLGKDPRINREVAIKTLRYDDVEKLQVDDIKRRFFHEAEAAGNLSHPNIVTIYDVGEDMGVVYMAMELVEGTELDVYCNNKHLMPMKKVLKVIASVAGALGYAHGKGVVHRDIKPSNIMILSSGKIKVTDFGIARILDVSKTSTGVIMGTPSYMSPEQISGKKVDGRSDLFSLGVVFYELLTGERPFSGENFAALMYKIANTTHISAAKFVPDIPVPVLSILDKLLDKRLSKRYKNGKQVSNDILVAIRTLKN